MDTLLRVNKARWDKSETSQSPVALVPHRSIVIVGSCEPVGQSLALLIGVRQRKHVYVLPISRWYADLSWSMPDVLIVDCAENGLPAASWLLHTLCGEAIKPYTIVIGWPEQGSIRCLADAFIEKPHVLPALLEALATLDARMSIASHSGENESHTSLPGVCQMPNTIIVSGRCRYRISAIPSSRDGWTMRVQCDVEGDVTSSGNPIDIAIEFASEQDVFDSSGRVVAEMDQRRVA